MAKIFVFVFVALFLVNETNAQSMDYRKLIVSGNHIAEMRRDMTKAELTVAVAKLGGRGDSDTQKHTVQNVGKFEVMWDVFREKLYFIKFYSSFSNDVRTGISAHEMAANSNSAKTAPSIFGFSDVVYMDPPPLDQNITQAMVDGIDLNNFYQPYDFIIDGKGIYFIVGNNHEGKYELWEYTGKFFPVDSLDAENADTKKTVRYKDEYLKSREKWKKHTLTDIPDRVQQGKILLAKEQGGFVFFTPEGRVYKLTKQFQKYKSVYAGKIKDEYANLIVLANKDTNTVSYLGPNDQKVLEEKNYAGLPLKSLDAIIKKD